MAASIFPPTITTSILVNTRTQPKIVYLPAVSTVGSGKLYFIKDICGNAGVSSIFISTTGLDSFDYRFRPSTINAIMSTNFQSVLLASDGFLNWLILQNYNANAISRSGIIQTNLPATPLVYLIATLYSGSGTWFDSSPNGRNATLENGVIAKNAAGNGIVLNGSTNWVFPNVAAGNVWTLSAWYKNTGAIVGTYPCVVTQFYTGNPNVINIVLGYGGGNVGYSFWRGGWLPGTNISLSNTNWAYFTGTWNGTTLTTYINGAVQGSTTPGGPSQDAGQQYRIGRRWDAAEYMRGEIGEVRIYPIALTSNQVMTDYTFGAPFYTN